MTSIYEKNISEKHFGRSTAHSCRTNVFIYFHHFKGKTMDTDED